jgi:DNA-directed RNA polymerase specialized sigma subunit
MQAVRAAEAAQIQAAQRTRQVARRLKGVGLIGTDIAAILGVTAQRVSQLLKG